MKNLILLFASIVFLGCRDDPTPVNIDTEPGTIKITKDGVTIVTPPYSGVSASVQSNGIAHIHGSFQISTNVAETLSIQIMGPKEGIFTFNGNQSSPAATTAEYKPSDNLGFCYSYNYSESISGTVQVTKYDKVNKVFTGTFEVKMTRPSDNKTITITKGYFKEIPFVLV